MRKKLLYFCIILLGLNACEDAIEVELEESQGFLSVDAWLDDLPYTDPVIKLQYALPYFDSLTDNSVKDALVTVTTGKGTVYTFEDNSNIGEYILIDDNWDQEEIGESFDLNISVGSKTYTASSMKNRVPQIDSISQELREDDVFADDGIYCNFFATDLLGLGDTYWIKSYKNDVYLNRPGEINIAYDAAFSRGSEVDNLVFIQPIQELVNPIDENFAPIPYVVGDSLRVEIHAISNEAYFFMEVLRDQLLNSSNGIFAEPQANTTGNISGSDGNEVLGYFNVASASYLTKVIE